MDLLTNSAKKTCIFNKKKIIEKRNLSKVIISILNKWLVDTKGVGFFVSLMNLLFDAVEKKAFRKLWSFSEPF